MTAQRLVRIQRILDECIDRRIAGQHVADEEIISAHPELMPELAEELRHLAVIERARQRASRSSDIGTTGPRSPNGPRHARSGPAVFIPGYTILGEIHRGGQGVVYKAIRTSTHQTVAIKVIREGALAGLRELARFEREVQILAALKHPNIVVVHDRGIASGGSVYYVMDYIEGHSLDVHLTDHPLRQRDALALFARICEAVHAAHLRGIIHRDLKPGNIQMDAAGEPHILDFGLAKMISEPDSSAMTVAGQFVGSLPWASPEQAEGAANIDLRTDVYSLGVILYQMLTGTLPFRVSGGIREMLERIVTEEPIRPSTLNKEIDGEVETIVLKCLSKQRDRRYQSARDLAADVRRYLAGEPIEAKRESTFYVVRKQLARHRVLAASAALSVLVLVGFGIYASLAASARGRLAERERAAKLEAIEARNQSESARAQADQEARHAQAVTEFLVDMLGLANPDIAEIPNMTIHSMLERASAEVGQAFESQPQAEAKVRTVIGRAYAALGRVEDARVQLARALKLTEANPDAELEETYEILGPYVEVLTDAHDRSAQSYWWKLWTVVGKLFEKHRPELVDVRAAFVAQLKEEFDEAEADAAYRELNARVDEALEPDDDFWLIHADQLHLAGQLMRINGQPHAAIDYLHDSLDIQRKFLSETHTHIARTLGVLIDCYLAEGRFEDAEVHARESLELLGKVLPEENWYTAVYKARLGACLVGRRQYAEAETLLVESQPRIVAARGRSNDYSIRATVALIELYESWGTPRAADEYRLSLALGLAESAWGAEWKYARAAFGPEYAELESELERLEAAFFDHLEVVPEVVDRILTLRRALLADEDPLSAVVADLLWRRADHYGNSGGSTSVTIRMWEDIVAVSKAGGIRHPMKTATALWWLAHNCDALHLPVQGESAAREAMAMFKELHGEHYWMTANSANILGACLGAQGRYEEGEPHILAGYRALARAQGSLNVNTYVALTRLVHFYGQWGRPESANPYIVSILSSHLRHQKPTAPMYRGATAETLAWISEQVVTYPGFSPEVYSLTLEAAERALAADDSIRRKYLLGAARYRTGQFVAALETLSPLIEPGELENPFRRECLAFAAMSHAAMGQDQQAADILSGLADPTEEEGDCGPPCATLLAEARMIVKGITAP